MTKRRKCISTIILVLFYALNLNAQSNTVLSQYFSTPLFYNPGSAGDNNSINIIGAGQIQHTKPTLEIKNGKASADMPLAINNHLTCIGVMADYSSIGAYRSFNASLIGSWKIKVGEGTLSIGITPGVSDIKIKPVDQKNDSQYEKWKSNTTKHKTRFDFGAGLWYKTRQWWTGISATHIGTKSQRSSTTDFVNLSQTENEENEEATKSGEYDFSTGMAFYFIAGGNIVIKSSLLDLEPSLLAAYSGNRLNGQATLRAIWKKTLWIGSGYRSDHSTPLMLGVDIKGFRLGYSYILPVNQPSKDRHNGHEITAGYRLRLDLQKKSRHRHKSVRIM